MSNNVEFYINEKIMNAWSLNKRYTVAYGGRGSGKSLQFGALCIIYAINNPKSRILCVRGFQNKISESSLAILKDVITMMKLEDFFIQTENTLSCKNGSEFLFYGGKSHQSFKSIQGIDLCFVDEATELSKTAWEFLTPSIRKENSRFLISFNPVKDTDWVYQNFIASVHPESSVVQINHNDNPFLPNVLRLEMEYDKSINHGKYLHIWEGQLRKDVEGALWTPDMIKYDADTTDWEKVVVSLDPSASANAHSDPCGIIVAGLKKDKVWIIEDLTRICTPNEWSDLAIGLYDRYQANAILAERNNGGMMVETIIKNKRKDIPYKGVWSHKGKIVRAEPVAVHYENGNVFHCKKLPILEYEMLTYSGANGQASPNSLDALVIAVTHFKDKVPKGISGMVKVDLSNLRI